LQQLVLLGAGHAHLHVLARLAHVPLPGVAVTLVTPSARQHYSGMVPGYLQGAYAEAELAVDLRQLCRAAGARLHLAAADRIEPARRLVVAGGDTLEFDVLSVDVGSAAAGLDTPGAREHAFALRPMSRVVALREAVDRAVAARAGGPVAIAVVGGGAGGVEVALALHRRVTAGGGRPAVTLLEGGPAIVGDFAPAARARILGVLGARGIALLTGRPVTAVGAGAVTAAGGPPVAADVTVWLAGAAAPGLLTASPVARDARGFLHVDATLRAVDGAPIWGAGDCVTLAEHPATPRAGVYAVRAGPVLDRNLRAALTGAGAPARCRPQRSFLALLNTADGKAILRWHGMVGHTRWAWWLKDRIDRRFMRRYQLGAADPVRAS
jgi:pyridine nucleotide-disulfide oxidoreductase family protein